jgi:hypothetical protein
VSEKSEPFQPISFFFKTSAEADAFRDKVNQSLTHVRYSSAVAFFSPLAQMLRRQVNLKKYKPLFDDDFKYAHYLELKKSAKSEKPEKSRGGGDSRRLDESASANIANSASSVSQSTSTASLSGSYESRKKLIAEIIAEPEFEEDLVVPDFMKLLCRSVESFATCEGVNSSLTALVVCLLSYLF